MKNAGPWRETGALLLSIICGYSGGGFAQTNLFAATSPPNDNFENRVKVSGSAIIANGSNGGAGKQSAEPYHGDSPGGASVWWAWTAPMAGSCTVSTEGSSFYTLLAVYCGGSLTNLSRVSLAPLFSGQNGTSKTSFYAIAGATYAIAVDGYYAATGAVRLAINQSPPSPANSWTKTASGNWEENVWSLGQPQASQSGFLTNSGSKAVSITSQTAAQFPATLSLSNLILTAPSGSYNTLLLNNAGVAHPLRIQDNLVVQSNSAVRLLSSALRVGETSSGSLLLGGTITHSDNSQAYFGSAQIGYGNAGEYDLTNGTLTAGSMALGANAAGAFNHIGGSVSVQNLLAVRNAAGAYSLRSGTLSAGALQIGQGGGVGGAQFLQSGGVTVASYSFAVGDVSYLNLASGSVALSGGSISTPLLSGVRGTFSQTGGSNFCSTSQLGGYESFIYSLSGGGWFSGDEYIGYHGAGVVNQSGGVHSVTNAIYVSAYGGYTGEGTYNLSNGTVAVSSLYVGAYGTWNQFGGVAAVGSTFGVGNGANVNLVGGSLRSSHAYVGDMSLEEYPVFTMSGGTHVATNDFTINAGTCRLLGGSLLSSNITLLSGILTNGGCSITNPGAFTFSGGVFYIGGHSLQFGRLNIGGHARLNFGGGPASVRFASNPGQAWYDFGLFTIENWAGATNGGGAHQLICGTSSGGISAQQLSKIVFEDPAGLRPGAYLAKVLPNGEIVPAQAASVTFTRQAKQMVLTWPTGFSLQSATNITGPFLDLPQATSPLTNNVIGEPQRYFRIFHY